MIGRPSKQAKCTLHPRDRECIWYLSDWFCRSCGKRDTWQSEHEGGDYYHDCSVTCASCGDVMCCVAALDKTVDDSQAWWVSA
jgi:hypothetical protein